MTPTSISAGLRQVGRRIVYALLGFAAIACFIAGAALLAGIFR